MSNVKNFGLIGVGSDVQFGKAGTRLINNAGVFNFKAANGSSDAALTSAGITSSGNVTLTTGNLVLSAEGGLVSIGGVNVLQKSTGGVAQISGTAGVVIPAGTTAQRGTGENGLVRMNTDTPNSHYMEFWDGDAWVAVATGGSTGTLQTEIDNIETSLGAGINTNGTFNAAGFTGAGLGSVTSFTDAINTVANAAAAKDTLEEIIAPVATGNVIYASSNTTWAVGAPGATSGVQAYDAGLAALAAKTSTGIMVQTGNDTYDSRTLVAPAAGITISNADGVSGNPTFALANDLAAVEGLATNGLAVRTADGVWTTRTITGVAGRISVSNGDGIAGEPTIDLATVTNSGSGTFQKVTVDSYGRVTGTQAVVAADIEGLVDGTYVNVAGDTMTGNLNMGGTFKVTGLAEPTASSDAATKNYVDNAVTGLSWKQAVHVLADSNVDVATGGLLTIDGHTLVAGDRVLLTNQTTASEEGIWVAAAGAWSRATDADTYQELNGAAVFVQQGTTYADTGWTQTATLTSFSGQNWAQFSGAGSYSAGDGLLLTGTVFSVNMGAGITTLPSDEVGIDVEANKAVQLTSALTGGQLTLVLASGSGLEQSSAGLKISTAGVTNAMLANSSFAATADSGTATLDLGDTLHIHGNATQGISVAVSGTTTVDYAITAADATSSQKGVASFTTGEFVVTSGNVALGTVPTNKLQNNSITFTGTSGSDAVVLGESMAIISADSAITTTMGANSLSIQLNTVDVAHGGTGQTTLLANSLLIGNGTGAVVTDADLAFNTGTNTLTLGASTIAAPAGGDLTITATGTNADINLVPNGTGQVVIGPSGAGVISADAGQSLTVVGNSTLVLQSTAGDIVMTLANNTTDKVTVSGPSAADYATNLADADLVNKKYVDDAIQSGAASGSIKAVKATVTTSVNGTYNIGAALPAGATILRVKVNVTVADAGSATLEVGKTGLTGGYMTTSENDTQSTGLYLAETYVTEGSSVQVIATVAGSGSGSGSATVIVEYQVA